MTNLKALTLSFILLLLTCFNCTPRKPIFEKVNAQKTAELLNRDDLQILDVRTPEEVSFGTMDNAIHIDFYDPEFKAKVEKLDKDSPILVYCAAGGRSKSASDVMKEMKFWEIYDLEVGYRGWQQYQANQ